MKGNFNFGVDLCMDRPVALPCVPVIQTCSASCARRAVPRANATGRQPTPGGVSNNGAAVAPDQCGSSGASRRRNGPPGQLTVQLPSQSPRQLHRFRAALFAFLDCTMSADAYNDKHGDEYINLEAHDGLSTDVGSLNGVTHVPYQVKSAFARQMMAEFFATFICVVVGLACTAQVTLSSGTAGSFVTVALAWGFAYFLGITVGGGVSGANLNPTVTVALALLGMLPWKKVPFYILAQTVASYVAAMVVYILYRPMLNIVDPERTSTNAIFATYPHENVGNFTCFLTEFFAAALLVVGFLALLDEHNRPIGRAAVPAAIGVLVSAIAMGFGMNTGLAINAARDLGPRLLMLTVGFGSRVFSLSHYYFWVPLVAPILGGAVGGIAYLGMVGYHHPGRSFGPYPEYRY